MNTFIHQSEVAAAKAKLDTQLEELIQLRPLPAIASRIMTACREEGTDVRALVQLVECDAVISSRVLSVANSSLFGYSREVSSISQAVVVLGLNKLSQLAIAVASESIFSDGDEACEARSQLYEHSLGCAAVSRLLANKLGGEADAGEAFLAGLLHDVGKLVLFDVAPIYYSELQAGRHDTNSIEIEQQAFGIDHAMLGAKFGETWGLPPQLEFAIANHHGQIDQTTEPLSQITALANELAKVWGVGQEAGATSCEMTTQWLEDCNPAALEELQQRALEQFQELKSLLAN